MEKKWKAFGLDVHVVDGHSSEKLEKLSEHYNTGRIKRNLINIVVKIDVYKAVKEMATEYNLPLTKVVEVAITDLYNEYNKKKGNKNGNS